MKNGKKPTKKQGEFIAYQGLSYKDWLIERDNSIELVVVHREIGETKKFIK